MTEKKTLCCGHVCVPNTWTTLDPLFSSCLLVECLSHPSCGDIFPDLVYGGRVEELLFVDPALRASIESIEHSQIIIDNLLSSLNAVSSTPDCNLSEVFLAHRRLAKAQLLETLKPFNIFLSSTLASKYALIETISNSAQFYICKSRSQLKFEACHSSRSIF